MRVLYAILMFFGTAAFAETLGEKELVLDELFVNLQTEDEWEEYENKILVAFSRSGSASMDLLLERGRNAMDADNFPKAVEHLSALIDHAPDFAEGYNARATAYYLMDEYGLSLADIRETLVRNPRHFGALAGLGFIYENLGKDEGALAAYLAAQAVHPHMDNVNEAVTRLQTRLEGAEL